MVVLGIFAFIGCVVELSSAFPQATEQLVPFAFQNGQIDEARFSACRGSRARWLAARSDASNQEMVECIKDLLAASYRNLRTSRGLPNLGVPPMEPLLVESASVKDSSVFTGTIKNIKVHGFSEAFLRQNVEVIPPKDASGVTVVKMKAPKGLSLTGDFEAVANILKSVLPFYSGPSSRVSGLFEATIDDPVLIVTTRYLQDAEKGATVDGVKLGFNFKGGNVKLNNERLLSGAILTLLNSLLEDQDVSRTVINEVTPDILRRFQEPMYNLLDSGLDESREILS